MAGPAPIRPVRIFDPVDANVAAGGLAGPRPRPFTPVRVYLGADQLLLTANPDGFLLFYGRLQRAGGPVRRERFAGRYTLRAESSWYESVELDVSLPAAGGDPEPYPLSLHPGPVYPYQVEES